MKEHTQTRRIPLTAVFSAFTALLIAVVLLPFMKPQKAEAATNFDLWVMGTRVTSENMSDILDNDAFSYDYGRNTLYVNARTYYTTETRYKQVEVWDPIAGFCGYIQEPYEVSIAHKAYTFYTNSNYNIIRSMIPDLKIVINDNVTFDNSNIDYKDYAPINISGNNNTISGSGSLSLRNANGNELFLGSNNSVTFDNAYVYFEGMNNIYNGGTITFNNSVVSFKAYQQIFSRAGKIVYNESHLDSPAGAKTTNGQFVDSNGNPVLEAKITKGSGIITYEGLKICGQEVNSANKDDILGGGEFSYDPDNKVLYVKKPYRKVLEGNPTVINNTGIDGLTINTTVSGCQIYNVDDGVSNPCINISKNTTFTGNNLSVYGDVYGIKVNGSAKLTMDSSVYVYADDYGIFGSSSASLALNVPYISAKSYNNIAAVKGFKTITIPDSITLRDMVYYISNGIRKGKTSSSPYADSIGTVTNEKFNLWINGTQIRTSNQYNILGDGDGAFGSGAMYFYSSSMANCLVLNAHGGTLNINSISSSMPNFYIVVMSDTTLRPSNPKSGQINFWTDTQIEGTGKLTVNNICVTDADLTISNMNNLQIGEDGIDGSSFLSADGDGNIYVKKSNVYVKKAFRTDEGYIILDGCYLAAPQNAEIKTYTGSSYSFKNAVCIGNSLAYGSKIYKDGTKPKFTNNSMTLGGSISLNFYADLSTLPSTRYADSYVEFEVCGKKQTAKFDPNKMNSAKTTYGFTCMLDAVSMADPVKATLYYYDNYGNLNSITTTSTAESYLEKFNANDPAKLWQLIKSINDYGYYMQRYLCDHSGSPWTLGVDHVAMKKAYIVASELKGYKSTYASELAGYEKDYNYNADIQKVNYSLALDADTSLIFKIKPAKNYTGKITVTVDGKTAKATKLSDGRYQVTVNNIAAHQLGDTHTVAIKTTKGTSTFEASALSYAYECVTDPTDDSELLAMSALYRYYLAAINYKS